MSTTGIYNDVVARIAAEIAADPVFAFNYDLATPPPVAEVGLNSFSEFMANPGDYEAMLQRVQEDAAAELPAWNRVSPPTPSPSRLVREGLQDGNTPLPPRWVTKK